MDSEQLRALLAVLLYVGDRASGLNVPEWNQEAYLQKAHYTIESSYNNYPHPARPTS